MLTLNLAEARNRFSGLVDDVHASGNGVVIARYGRPVAMIVPYSPPPEKPDSHPLRGLPYRMSDDFDDPMPGLAAAVAESGPGFGAGRPSRKRRRP